MRAAPPKNNTPPSGSARVSDPAASALRSLALQTHLATINLLQHPLYIGVNEQVTLEDAYQELSRLSFSED